eukprot:COSAG01_NODE_46573_length_399_cov_0.610000_2_plen_113_part_00
MADTRDRLEKETAGYQMEVAQAESSLESLRAALAKVEAEISQSEAARDALRHDLAAVCTATHHPYATAAADDDAVAAAATAATARSVLVESVDRRVNDGLLWTGGYHRSSEP